MIQLPGEAHWFRHPALGRFQGPHSQHRASLSARQVSVMGTDPSGTPQPGRGQTHQPQRPVPRGYTLQPRTNHDRPFRAPRHAIRHLWTGPNGVQSTVPKRSQRFVPYQFIGRYRYSRDGASPHVQQTTSTIRLRCSC